MLDLAILGLLSDHNLHGYEIRRRVSQMLGPIGRLSFGTLYPALNRLESASYVRVVSVSESRTGLTTTRGRKVYQLTDSGRAHFDELLAASNADDERDFALRLTFASHLSAEARLRLLNRRREQLAERLEDEEAALHDDSAELDSYGQSVRTHRVEMLRNDVNWLERMIASEHRSSLTDNTRTDIPASASRRGK